MTHRLWRISTLCAVLLAAFAVSGSPVLPGPASVRAAGDANASFNSFSPVNPANPADTVNPPRLYAGDFSHPGTAKADLVTGTNGYCVTAHTQGLVPAANIPVQNVGFTVQASNDQATWAMAGSVLTAAGPSGAGVAQAGSTNGDLYCVIVRAPAGYAYARILWYYTGSQTGTIASDTILVRTVTLRAMAAGSFATVCTVGWDGTFLTGHQSNVAGTLPDPLDQVGTADWSVSSANVTVQSVQRDPSDSTQWCASLKSNLPNTAVTTDVTFAFDAVYNRMTNLDDQAHTVSLAPNLLTIPGGFSLAHIGAAGDVLTQQVSPPLVTGSRAAVCILGTDNTANMQPADVSISNVPGADQPTTSGIQIFHASGGGNFSQMNPNVPAGTLCFSWTSSSPGEQTVTAGFTDGTGPHRTQWSAVAQAGQAAPQTGPLVVMWNRIDRTDITSGGTPDGGTITYTTVDTSLTFVVPLTATPTGNFSAGTMTATEWVSGSHRTNGKTVTGFLQGAVLHATIEDPTGQCGHFLLPGASGSTPNALATSLGVPSPAKVSQRDIWGFSIGGRFSFGGDTVPSVDDLKVSIGFTTDTDTPDSCSPGMRIRVKVDVFYPGQSVTAKPTEYVDFAFTYTQVAKTPRLAWAGQVVPISYGFSGCPQSTDIPVVLSRGSNQPGAFISSAGVALGSGGSVTGNLNTANGCTVTAYYTSPDPGEVDIQAMIQGNPYSKRDFPIFFMAIEDVVASAPPTSVVSTVGDVTAVARGYFVGSNPSGRAAETKADGRKLPADRWVIPDDWPTLQGMADFRPNWPSPDLPYLNISFFMENEDVVNSFSGHVTKGGVGWMMPYDGADDGNEANSEVGKTPIGFGQPPKDRTLSDRSDTAGVAAVDIFGDYNLSFEGCAVNAPTGNPQCKTGEIVGHTRYFAVADYPQNPGKFPQVKSNVVQTDWTWGGLKQVTVINGDDPTQKYVVAHLVDRDGYCDAASWNNTLGVRVQFQIDSGDGRIIEVQGYPSEISGNGRVAWATTFDTVDDLGNKMHEDITRTTVADGECQAWVKISDSLLNPVNVIVTFPAQPAPIPGDIRITGLLCAPNLDRGETVTVTNKGKNAVSLEGFALRSKPVFPQFPEQHLGLTGLLLPGQSLTFLAGPNASGLGWFPQQDHGGNVNWVFNDGADDYARLVWNNFELSRATCDGKFFNQSLSTPLPPDGEGALMVDVIIPFGMEKAVRLSPGWNAVPAGVAVTNIKEAFAGFESDLLGVYLWDEKANAWKRYLPGVPADPATAITTMEKGQVYWVAVKRAFTVTLLK